MYLVGEISPCVWDKIYRSEIWEDIRFPYGKESEDLLVNLRLFSNAQVVHFLDVPLYYHDCINAGSRSRSRALGTKWMFDDLEVRMEYEKVAQGLGDSIVLKKVRVMNLQLAVQLYCKECYRMELSEEQRKRLQAYLRAPWVREILPNCRNNTQREHWLIRHFPFLVQWYGKFHYAVKAKRYEKELVEMEKLKGYKDCLSKS